MHYNRYFQDELAALRVLGQEFSETNPRLAPFLSGEGVDPDVERLLEGFAFLTGRIRQKLDDDLPEFAWSLIKLIWPHFLQTIPAMTTVELTSMDILSEQQRLDKGAQIKSVPVDGTACLFQTVFNVDLFPFQIETVSVDEVNGRSTINVNLAMFQHSALKDIQLGSLRLHFHGAFSKTSLWYYLLRQKVSEVEVWSRHGEGRTKLGALPASSIAPGGMSAAETLLPSLQSQFTGHRLLFEYFCYPEKFLYVDASGVDELIRTFVQRGQNNLSNHDLLIEGIELVFVMDYSLPINDHPTKENIKLFCTPAINQFPMDMRPFQRDERRSEHRVSVESSSPDDYEILDIAQLEGWSPSTRTVTHYPQMESFAKHQHEWAGNGLRSESMAYWAQQRQSVSGSGMQTYLSFMPMNQHRTENKRQNGRLISSFVSSQPETLSGKVTCCNRQLPSRLSIGDINIETSSIPEYLYCQNIASITPSYSPATQMNWIWRLISLSALNINKIDDVEDLKRLISHFDVRGLFDRQQNLATQLKVEGLVALTITPSVRLFKGVPVRGSNILLEVDADKFAGIGDLFLFGEIINQFFTLSAPINSFQHLTIKTRPDGEIIQWKARSGDCPLS